MRYDKKTWILTVAVLALGACSTDSDRAELLADDATELRLSAVLTEGDAVTRADSALQLSQINSAVKVGIILRDSLTTATNYSKTYNANHHNLQYTANGSGTLTNSQTWPADGNNLYIFGYAPYQSKWNLTGTNSFSCNTDQTSSANYLASDLISGKANTNPATRTKSAIGMTFTHALTKVTVVLKAGTGADLSQVTTVDLLNTKYTGTVTMSGGVISAATAGGTATTINLVKSSSWPAGSGKYYSSAVIYPQTITQNTNFIQIKTSGHTFTWPMDVKTDFAAGKHYIFNVTVNMLGVTVTSTIKSWNTENTSKDATVNFS
ncbi:MAG: fimbrillin family protein [Prevotella sp.]|nr:fimbrillin family protein [Prevotella sp.]